MEPCSVENLAILYQSSNFIVLNKHWDIRIDSKMWYEKVTVQSQLKHRFPGLSDPETYYGFRFCHQLDFSTSGALCVALSKAAAARAYTCFKERTATKVYLALLRGSVSKQQMMITHAIGKNTAEGMTHMMCTEETEGCENAKPCQTELIVLEHGMYRGEPVTKVILQPHTGRTHQLRVHCSAIGHPIVGDFTYSLKKDTDPYRMMLHAYYLRLPVEEELIEVTAPDPFVSMVDDNWVSLCTVCSLEETIQELKAQIILDAQEQQRALLECPTKNARKIQKKNTETEELLAVCQEWLAEWALE
ncbi:RNA pseudouridylate synthase domain-containing protein 1 [Ambystoma mexicanum]|uniref:RNA pseudouridylate synthase domain-containing protein 1 n=1 Tax=Ambystoma mexicanum TaxID=8296 RepID=UPI0037E913D0